MKGTILLSYNENTKKIEDEEQGRFLRSILEQMGVPIQDFWATDAPLNINQKIKLRSILSTYEIQVIDDLDGNIQIFVAGEAIASWQKPIYRIKRDLREIDPRKQLYLEMIICYSSLFEQDEEKQSDLGD